MKATIRNEKSDGVNGLDLELVQTVYKHRVQEGFSIYKHRAHLLANFPLKSQYARSASKMSWQAGLEG